MAAGPPGCGRSEAERGPASSHGAGCERGPRPALGASPHPGNADEIGTSASACSSPRCEPRFPLGSLKKQRGLSQDPQKTQLSGCAQDGALHSFTMGSRRLRSDSCTHRIGRTVSRPKQLLKKCIGNSAITALLCGAGRRSPRSSDGLRLRGLLAQGQHHSCLLTEHSSVLDLEPRFYTTWKYFCYDSALLSPKDEFTISVFSCHS
ncbi:uncharacterized protein LOC110406907 isoform X1 [Numida meleagris]|uniref:uncharacterized protein LOC110406907 isoform X1 n=1 Tax=Numida meleagris TaxID=8996 RepID=UPI000B3D8C3B|nr:uncharacterized protein LOC110406907 isoform X1 [Numida meleagris]